MQFLGMRNTVYRTFRRESISKTIQQISFKFLCIFLEDVSSSNRYLAFIIKLISLLCTRRMPDDACQFWPPTALVRGAAGETMLC